MGASISLLNGPALTSDFENGRYSEQQYNKKRSDKFARTPPDVADLQLGVPGNKNYDSKGIISCLRHVSVPIQNVSTFYHPLKMPIWICKVLRQAQGHRKIFCYITANFLWLSFCLINTLHNCMLFSPSIKLVGVVQDNLGKAGLLCLT